MHEQAVRTGRRVREPALGSRQLLIMAAVLGIFALQGTWPVPDVNEAHYLCKARHFWNASYIPRDQFLDSGNAHLFFFAAFGWLTSLLSLPVAAWIGRLVTWIALTWTFVRFQTAQGSKGWQIVLAAALFAAFQDRMHLAGEWVLGGFEAKGPAYALVFLAWSQFSTAGKSWLGWLLLGLAGLLHVLVVGWAFLICLSLVFWQRPALWENRRAQMACALAGLLIVAGALPALLMGANRPADEASAAWAIHVYGRLSHHLLGSDIPLERWLMFGGLAVLACLLAWKRPRTRPWTFSFGLAAVSLLCVVAALILSWLAPLAPHAVASVLRFYWFRMADVVIPLLAATHLSQRFVRRSAPATEPKADTEAASPQAVGMPNGPSWPAKQSTLICAASVLVVCGHFAWLSWQRAAVPIPRSDVPQTPAELQAWQDACTWMQLHTPQNSVCLTPRNARTFKWYAGRAEVATWKDLPQDPYNTVQWWRRMCDVFRPPGQSYGWVSGTEELPDNRISELATRYQARYLVERTGAVRAFPKRYETPFFVVYELTR